MYTYLVLQVGEPVLGHAGGGIVELLLTEQLDAAVREGAADHDLGLQGRQPVLDGLQRGDRRAEGLRGGGGSVVG